MTKQFTVQRSRSQVRKMEDFTREAASPRESLGPGFWREAVPLYPSRGRRLARPQARSGDPRLVREPEG